MSVYKQDPRDGQFEIVGHVWNECRDELGVDPEIEVYVGFNYIPGDPGKYSGRPEDCYPPTDPEIEITSVKDVYSLRDVVTSDADIDRLEAECFEWLEHNHDNCDYDDDIPF